MATLSSPGIGTGGLDVKSIITQLVALEQRPLNTLKLQAATTTTKISAFGQIQSLVSTLNEAVGKLGLASGWNGVTATSSDKDSVSVTAIPNTKPTSFDVKVKELAVSQRTFSGEYPSSEALGAGSLSIQLGSWGTSNIGDDANSNFTPRKNEAGAMIGAININVKADDTISDIASSINGANAGITATIYTGSDQKQRLVLTSKETGEEFGFNIEAKAGIDGLGSTLDAATGLGRLSSAASAISGADNRKSSDAVATIVGIPGDVKSSNNIFTNIMAGVTFKAEKVDADKIISISVAADTSAAEANIEAFVKAYNEVNKVLNDGSKYDAATKSTGLLQGDSTAIGLQNMLRSAMQAVNAGSQVFQRLADIGVVQKTAGDPMATIALGGEMTVSSKLKDLLGANPEAVKKFFIGDGPLASNGFAKQMQKVTSGLLAGDGFFKSKESVLKGSLKRNEKDQEITNMKINNFEKRLTARYTALDVQMSGLNALNAYISQQVTTWNKSNN